MPHDHFDEMLLDFDAGELDASGEAEFSAHLRECAECRDKVAMMRALHALADVAAATPCPDVPELLAHVRRDAGLSPERRGGIETHLQACAACRRLAARMAVAGENLDRLERLAVVETEPATDRAAATVSYEDTPSPYRRAPGGRSRLAGWTPWLVAASLVLALGNLAQLALHTTPRPELRGWVETGSPAFLSGPDRGRDDGLETVHLSRGDITLIRVSDLQFDVDYLPGDELTVTVTGAADPAPVFTATTPFAPDMTAANTVIAINLPTRDLAPGVYTATIANGRLGTSVVREFRLLEHR